MPRRLDQIVVHNRRQTLVVGHPCIRCTAENNQKGLVRFGDGIAIDDDGDVLSGLPGIKRQARGFGHVVTAGLRCVIGRVVTHHHRLVASRREGHRKNSIDRSRVTLYQLHPADRNRRRRIIVDDGQDRGVGTPQARTARGVAQSQIHGLVTLEESIIANRDTDGFARRISVGKAHYPGSGGVVRTCRGRPIAGGHSR